MADNMADKIGTKLGQNWDKIGTKLGQNWDKIGTKLGQNWDKIGTKLGQNWDKIGTKLISDTLTCLYGSLSSLDSALDRYHMGTSVVLYHRGMVKLLPYKKSENQEWSWT